MPMARAPRLLPDLAPPTAPARPPIVGSLFRHRALDAYAKSLVCFALVHQVRLAVHVLRGGDAGVFNVFAMIEAHRLLPSLAVGAGGHVLSLLFALAVYALVWARFTRGAEPDEATVVVTAAAGAPLPFPAALAPRTRPRDAAPGAVRTGWPDHLLGRGRRRPAPIVRVLRPTLPVALAVAAGGVAVHMAMLALVERWVHVFPSVPDVVHARLPYVDFGVPGELCFAAFLAVVITVLLRTRARHAPEIVTMLGLFYALRGLFLFAMPIGLPPTAPALGSRFVLYPFAGHAYFPGGHMGVMTILALSVPDRLWRRGLLAATVVFGVGTMLARTHYTGDVLGGLVIGYAVFAWGRRHLGAAFAGAPA